MQQIIITTPEELETLIQKSFTNALSTHVPPVEQEEKFISLKTGSPVFKPQSSNHLWINL